MTALVSTIDIARPPDEVFAYVTDPTRFPEWQRDVVRVNLVDDRPPDVGSRFTTTRRFAGGEHTLTQEITENEAPRRWAARGIDGPVRPSAAITVRPTAGGTASRVTFELDFAGHGVGVGLVPLVRRQAQAGAPVSYQNVKRLLETGRAVR